MLTRGDDYPIHQTPEPVAYAGTDRNFYDRYFFNGYTADGATFFAAALGVYPHLNIMDASFCVVRDGVQHNLHASRVLNMERMDIRVGPISIDIVEPLNKLRVRVGDNEYGITADVTFAARALPVEEPRFVRRIGPRTVMDYTRLTQNGCYSGWVDVKGDRVEVTPDAFVGTRDRSWGVRPVGAADSQPVAPPPPPQFYWLWAPLNFEDCFSLYHLNDDTHGRPWNTEAVVGALGETEAAHIANCRSDMVFKSGTRHAQAATLFFDDGAGGETRIELEPQWNFYMSGLGYMSENWGHGHYKGELAVGYEEFDLNTLDESEMRFLHVQAFVKARMLRPDGSERLGCGVLEQLIIGAHEPSGFRDVMDMAP